MSEFQLVTRFQPAGDQPEAIPLLVEGSAAARLRPTTHLGKAPPMGSLDGTNGRRLRVAGLSWDAAAGFTV